MTYKEQLLSPQWQKKKTDILLRDKFTCRNCNSTEKTLHVHHLLYLDIKAWEYPNDMLVTLCVDCHNEEQKRSELERHLATTLKMKGFFVSDLLAMSCKIDEDLIFTKALLKILREYQDG